MKIFGKNYFEKETPLQKRESSHLTMEDIRLLKLESHVSQNLANLLNVYTENNYWNLYRKCQPLATVVNKRASFALAGKFKVIDIKSGKVIENDPLIEKLETPNNIQTKSEFLKSIITFASLFGYCHVYNNSQSVIFAKDVENAELFALNPEFETVTVKKHNGMFAKISDYNIMYQNQYIDKTIEIDRISTVIDTISENPIQGYSRVSEIKQECSNIIKTRESENVIISRPGGVGLIVNDSTGQISTELTKAEKTEIENELNANYGVAKGKSAWVVSNANLKMINLLQPYENFGFKESFDSNELSIVKTFNMPLEIYSNNKSTYENIDKALKMYIEFEIQPLMDNICISISEMFDYQKKGKKIICDFSEASFFQKDKISESQTLVNLASAFEKLTVNGQITKDEINLIMQKFKIYG